MKTILAIIPARGGSKGIHRKNLQKVAGKPLVVHAIEQALASKYINRVLVNTEDMEIAEVAKRPGVEVMGRPDELAHDNARVDPLLIWTVKEFEKRTELKVDIVVLLYPTAPLRRVSTIDEAVRKVLEKEYDSVLSLYEDNTYLWRKKGDTVEPINYDPPKRGPRQGEDWNQWGENKAVYVMTRDSLINTGCRLGEKIGYVEMSKLESMDVDTPADLALVKAIMERELVKE